MKNLFIVMLFSLFFPTFLFSTVRPMGGENGDFWRQSSTRTIQWDTSDFHGNVNIYIWERSSGTFYIVDTNISASSGTYSYNIPSDFPIGDDFRIKLQQLDSTNREQFSESFFPIYTASSPIHVAVKESVSKEWKLMVFPNPAIDYLYISLPTELPQGKIEIFSIEGTKIFETEPMKRIDVKSLCPGVYFIKVGGKVEKFLKM